MHAFDLDTFEGTDIRVREARAGEKLATLDGKCVTWKQMTSWLQLLINPVALGVMGDQAEISENLLVLSLKLLSLMANQSVKTSGV